MLFFEERARLVILTRSLLLTQYQVADDGRVTRIMQVKMSVAGDLSSTGLHSVVWAGSGVLAIATQERMLRLQRKKRIVADAILGEGEGSAALTEDDVELLFAPLGAKSP